MERIYIALALDLTDQAPDGAGWYIDIFMDGKRLMAPMLVSANTAYELSQDFADAMQESPSELPSFSVMQIVQSGNQQIYDAIKRQLEEAEEAASKIAHLRRQLATAPQPVQERPRREPVAEPPYETQQ
jgi:hypothetical protein